MEILSAAAAEARRLQQPVAGPECVLLAILRREGCDAAKILRDLGVDATELERRLTLRDLDRGDNETSITFPPIMYTLKGRAEAFAVALGDGHATPEYALLALMWDTRPVIGRVDGADIRLSILEGLREAGYRVPSVEPPPFAPALTQRVVLDDARDADAVREHLVQSKVDGWGWNVNERGTRWFVAPRDIDLLAFIDQVIGPGRAREVGFDTPDKDLV